MRKELLKGLSEEQIKKVKECKSSEEILALAKAEGVQLSDEQLEAVSGGCSNSNSLKCPECGSKNVKEISKNVKAHYTLSNLLPKNDKEISKNVNGDPTARAFKCCDCGREFEA